MPFKDPQDKKDYDAQWYQDHKPHRARYMKVRREKIKLAKEKEKFKKAKTDYINNVAPIVAEHKKIIELNLKALKIINNKV